MALADDVAALPVNLDTTYADSGADASVKVHQQHHDTIHAALKAAGSAPVSVTYSQAGSATVSTSGSWRAPGAGATTRLTLSCATAPAGSALTVLVKKNGTTVSTLTISAGSTTAASDATAYSFVAGDLFSVEATSVGSTTAATGVVLQLDAALT